MIKQVLVIRKDLNMRKGKMVAQGAHASMKVFFDLMKKQQVFKMSKSDDNHELKTIYSFESTKEMEEWIDDIFTKICVSVDSEAELLQVYESAKADSLPVALIQDHGLTEFNGVLTNTCIAIGPDEAEKIDKITGHLKLL